VGGDEAAAADAFAEKDHHWLTLDAREVLKVGDASKHRK